MSVTSDSGPEARLWLMLTEEEDPKQVGPTPTIWAGGEWLSVSGPSGRQPYEFVLSPKPGAFPRPGSYGASVAFQANGTMPAWTTVYANVAVPVVDASTHHVRFQMAPGGNAPAPRTILVAPVPGSVTMPLPVPTVTFSNETCGEWIDAAVTTSGTGYALTLSPVGAALTGLLFPLPSGATCHVAAAVRFTYDPAPGGGSPWDSTVDISGDLAVQTPATELAEASHNALSFSVLEGNGAVAPPQTVTVIDALGGTLTRPALAVSHPWLTGTLSATQPYVVTVSVHNTGLAAGTYLGTVSIGDPASLSSDRIEVTLRVDAPGASPPFVRSGWTMGALGPTLSDLQDGRFLVAGGVGWGRSDPGVRRCESLSCRSPSSEYLISRMMTPRYRHTATAFAPGHLVAVGGLEPATDRVVSTWEVYDDPHFHTWYLERPLVTPRFLHTATALQDGRVLVAGGAIGTPSSPVAISDAELLDALDPVIPGWVIPPWGAHSTAVASMTAPRRDAAAVLLPDGRVLVAGGQRVMGEALASAELFDPGLGRWALTGAMNEPRADAALLLLEDGRVLAAGGTDGQRALATAELYDPATGRWSYTGSMAIARVAPGVRLLGGKVLVVSGLTGSVAARSVTDTVEEYDPLTGTWSVAGHLNVGRTGHAVVALYGYQVVVAGGTTALPWSDDTLVSDLEVASGGLP